MGNWFSETNYYKIKEINGKDIVAEGANDPGHYDIDRDILLYETNSA